jgi:hypothetical protein
MRQDYRQFDCARCGTSVAICSPCDRGQRYCAQGCAEEARRESLQAAGRRYQATFRGRQQHAARQARYRQRQQEKRQLARGLLALCERPASYADPRQSLVSFSVLAEKVTHQGTQSAGEAWKLDSGTSAESRPGEQALRVPVVASCEAVVCHFCGARCRPIARCGPLRRRR